MSSKEKKEPKAKAKKPQAKAARAKAKAEPAAATKVEVPKPKGPPPRAVVNSRHDGAMVEREARGFSLGELGGAGFNVHEASRLGLAMDVRRRTTLEENVESLKSWFTPPKPAPAPKPVAEEPAEAPAPKPKRRAPAKKTGK